MRIVLSMPVSQESDGTITLRCPGGRISSSLTILMLHANVNIPFKFQTPNEKLVVILGLKGQMPQSLHFFNYHSGVTKFPIMLWGKYIKVVHVTLKLHD